MSVWQVTFGATAVTNFWHQMLYGIWKALPRILALLLPIPTVAVLVGLKKLAFPRVDWRWPILAALLAVGFHYSAVGVMLLNNRNAYSAYRLYTDSSTATEISVKNIGLLSTSRLECKYVLFREKPTQSETVAYPTAQPDASAATPDELEACNTLDLDFDELSSSTTESALQKLDEYFKGVTPTSKNEYTGELMPAGL